MEKGRSELHTAQEGLRAATELHCTSCAADLGAWEHSGCALQLFVLLRLQLINQITL